MKRKTLFCFVICACLFATFTLPAFSQSTTTGGLAGVISDPSGAVVPKAKVSAKSEATGATLNTVSNDEGYYRFALLQPGTYTISVSVSGFEQITTKAQVALNQVTTINIPLAVGTKVETIEVKAPVIQVDTADLSTSFSVEQVSQLPNPGNDLSAVAQTAPGVVMNTGGGFGNFSSFGLPATSNLFTLNGMNDNDPFLNLNNSGATNLLLGANDVQEATVVNNGYSPQYGQLAGAQINYITKSGTNQWHGNAVYYWNGRSLNANDYFNNATQTPVPFDNVNQWAVGIGGPIRKDKTFFYFNYEGLRVVLPTSAPAFIPSGAFQTATLGNVPAASVPFYQNMFNLYNGAKGASGATNTLAPSSFPVDPTNPASPIVYTGNGCGNNFIDSATTGLFAKQLPAGSPAPAGLLPCATTFQSTAGNFTHEYTMNLRIDQIFSDSDKIFGRAQVDRGVQATFTDPINSTFNAVSTQPEFQSQISWTHVFGSSAVNEFKVSDLWYSAIFSNANNAAARALFPTSMIMLDGSLTGLGGINFAWPQGRNVNQYQFVDDYQMTKGKHTWKFGANFHRDDVTDYDYGTNTSGTLLELGLDSFYNGSADIYQQAFPTRLTQPIALYNLGAYVGDEWRVTNKLKLSLSLRLDHNSNPVCQTNCFARLTQPFTTLAQNPAADTIPYNKVIQTGLHQAYPSTDMVVWQPRFGFTWSPFSDNKTVLSGGIGIFSDSFPATVVDAFSKNAPVSNQFTVFFNTLSPASDPNSAFAQAAAANKAFIAGFNSGATPVPGAGPNFTSASSEVRQPRYQEWNLRIQRDLGWRTAFSINYVGNHGIFEVVPNSGVNAFGDLGKGVFFAGLPKTAPDDAFGQVTQYQSIATSNYNGVTMSVHHDTSHGLQFQANYTWSHALDEISNAGLLPYNQGTAPSIGTLINPFNLRANYGNADYDIRHNFNANYVWENSLRHLFRWGPNAIFSGWTLSGTFFVRSGTPFSVIDSAITGALGANNYTGPVLASVMGPTNGTVGCNISAANVGNSPTPCLNVNGFSPAGSLTAFGNQARNQFRGPGYFDTDFAVTKHNKIPGLERGELNVGFQFFNLLNHPNLDNPVNDVNSPRFGLVTRTVNTPTSILGSFLGGDASPRLIQLKAEFKF
jgi:hypothetical protein